MADGLQSPSLRLFICGLQYPRVCQFILKFIDLLYDFQSSWWDWWIILGQIRNIIILIRAFVDSCMHNTDWTLSTHWGRDKMVTILQAKFSICISLNENDCICIQNLAWHRICDQPLIEPMMTQISDAYMLQRIQFRKLPLQFKYSYAYYVIKSNLISVAYLILNGSLEHMLVLCWLMKNNHCWPRVRNISFFPTCIKNFCATDISLSVLRIVQNSWWRHQMETFSALLAICAGNSPVSGEFPAQRPVTRSFDVFFDVRLIKRLSKHSRGWWFETLSHPLWRHRNVLFNGTE